MNKWRARQWRPFIGAGTLGMRAPPNLKLSRAVTICDVDAGFRDRGSRRPGARGRLEAGPDVELHVVVLDAKDDVIPQRVFEADAGRPALLLAARTGKQGRRCSSRGAVVDIAQCAACPSRKPGCCPRPAELAGDKEQDYGRCS